MPIFVDEKASLFHLQAKNMSYIFRIMNGYPVHGYWGKKLNHQRGLAHLFKPYAKDFLDRLPQEYPQYGSGDHRNPAYQIRLEEDGSRISELVYKSCRIVKGKPKLAGLPAVYTETDKEAETLEVVLTDPYSGLEAILSYTVFKDFDCLARSVRFTNKGKQTIRLLRALSASVDFPDNRFDVLYLSGAWSREAHIQRRPIGPGITAIESRRGASGHQLNPFMALLSPNADEDQGEVYGFSFVYSGNFLIAAEVDQFFTTRVSVGINPFDFSWKLAPGESFQTPETVMVYSSRGIGEMSRTFHRLYRTRLARGVYRDKERPILVNNWEATYFNFNEEKLVKIAKAAAELGIELFVLDDGWFGKRDDDTTSLGDWQEDRRKLPHGLAGLAKRVNDLGLKFGLWVEPEMVSPESELYKKHPDWCLHVKGRRRTLARNQLILDLSRQDVREYIIETFSGIFSRVPVSFVKWDMNRNMTEIGSEKWPADRQMEIAHRYILGLYEILERLTSAFPHILFENCSSGGGRFDPGMLYYMPQTWTSDNTDAVERLKIQYGTSLVYPISAIGSHVSAVPNHQVGRVTPLATRGHVAMSGNFGYELDLTKLTEKEKKLVKEQVARYKQIRRLVQQGDFYRLLSPFEGNETAWMFVSEDKKEAVVFYFRVLSEPHPPRKRLLLKGLDPDRVYRLGEKAEYFAGDQLMGAGIPLRLPREDFTSLLFKLSAAT